MSLKSLTHALVACTTFAALLTFAPDADAKRRKGPPEQVENALAYAPSDRDRAIELLEDGLAGRKLDEGAAWLTLHAGEQYRLKGDAVAAEARFRKVLEIDNSSEPAAGARMGLALIKVAAGVQQRRSMNTLREIADKYVLDTQNADRHMYLAIDAAQRDETGKMQSHMKKALTFAASDAVVLARIESTFETLADTPPEQVDTNLAEGPGGPLEKAEQAYLDDDFELARRLATKASSDEDPDIAAAAEDLLRALDAPVQSDVIAVILPLSDRYAAVGQNIEQAFRFGYGRGAARLEFIDSGSTPETAVEALERAVLDRGAIAVVGPLLSPATEPVVNAAEALHVPLVSLSQAYETPEEGTWGFQAMYSRGDQIEALLEWVTSELEMDAFAVFGPDSDFGNNAMELFVEGVESRGGTIKALAKYDPAEQNLLPFAEEFGEREGDLGALRAKARAQGGNPDTVVLPPVINFDAVFLPENARRTPLASAALAYNEFPMGTFQPRRGQPELPLLGMSTWNDLELVSRGNEYTRNSLFPDVFSSAIAADDDPFIADYRAQTDRTPSPLEVAVVDAGRLVAAAADERAQTRSGFRTALLNAYVPDSLTGASGFDPETRRAKRNMMILTITRSSIERKGEVALHGAEPRVYEEAPE